MPEIDKVLGAGSSEPGLHVRVIVVPSLGPYKAGKDTPVYGDNLGPHCYEVPFKGIAPQRRGTPARQQEAQAMNRRSLAAPLVKSIIFVVITVTITAILGVSIAYSGTSGNVGYKAVFSDVTGLVVGNDVDIAGVRVGTVTSISVYHRNEALVGFSLQQGRQLPVSATATIKYLNLVGQRYIELGQGTGPVDRTLAAGGTIPLNQTTPALNLTELFNGFQPLFQALSPGDVNKLSSEIIEVFQGESPDIVALVATVGSLTTSLATKDRSSTR